MLTIRIMDGGDLSMWNILFSLQIWKRESIKCMKHSCCSEGIIKYVSTYGSNYKDTKQIPQPTQTQQVP